MVTMKWVGPYSPGEVMVGGTGLVDVRPGQSITVADQVAVELMAADGSWWQLVATQAGPGLGAFPLGAPPGVLG